MTARKGFTLIEIVAVLIIISISAAVILPNISTSVERTKAQSARSNLLAISAAQAKYFEDHNGYCLVGCGDSLPNINANLNLGISTSDSFTYTCTAAGTLYQCVANDLTDTLTLTVSATGVNIVCAPAGGNCPF